MKFVVLFLETICRGLLQVAVTRQQRGGDLEQIQCVFSSECFFYLAWLFQFYIRIQQVAVCKVE